MARAMPGEDLVPGELVVFDWHGRYMAEGIAPKGGNPEWIELVPGDPGLIVIVSAGNGKPYTVLFGRQNRLVLLAPSMIKRAKKRSERQQSHH